MGGVLPLKQSQEKVIGLIFFRGGVTVWKGKTHLVAEECKTDFELDTLGHSGGKTCLAAQLVGILIHH